MAKLLRIRQSEAQQRDAARAKRSDAQQLKLLAQRPGESKRERARIQARVATAASTELNREGYIATPEPQAPKKVKRQKAKRNG